MSDYIRTVGAAVVLAALMDMLVPDGSFKGYCRLAFGFVLLAAVLSPLTGTPAVPSVADLYSAPDAAAAEAEARARILLKHRENLEELIEREFAGCEAYVEVDGEGEVVAVTVENAADAEAVRDFVRRELGVDESGVSVNENKGASER